MADVKISALPTATTPLAGTEVLPIVQSATTKQVAVSDLTAGRAMSASSLTLTTPLSVSNGGTGLTSLTAGYIPYGNGTGAFSNSSSLTFNGSTFSIGAPGAQAISNGLVINNASSSSYPGFEIQTAGTTQFYINATNGASYIASSSTNPMVFYTNSAERARIDASGNLLVGTTSFSLTPSQGYTFYNASNSLLSIGHANGTATGNTYIYFAYNSAAIGSISQDGTTGVLYNTSSDASLKENVGDAESALTSILTLPIRQFDWKADASHTDYGVVAQEAHNYAPEMVTQGDLWSVDYGRITPRLIKAFQELAAKVSALEAKQ